MAEDICRKSAIIETYVMDSRIGNTHTHTHTLTRFMSLQCGEVLMSADLCLTFVCRSKKWLIDVCQHLDGGTNMTSRWLVSYWSLCVGQSESCLFIWQEVSSDTFIQMHYGSGTSLLVLQVLVLCLCEAADQLDEKFYSSSALDLILDQNRLSGWYSAFFWLLVSVNF